MVKAEQVRRRVLACLESVGIEPIIESPPVIAPTATVPPAPARLIAEALTFVRVVRGLSSVICIALIGSLTTHEPDPKHADLLVTVTDEADLAPLAALTGKLQGHAQVFNRGGEVFLAEPQEQYLGRTCPRTQCGPDLRARRDVLHCGRRPSLHDDLETIRLAKGLSLLRPIELWPHAVAQIAAPQDMEQGLLKKVSIPTYARVSLGIPHIRALRKYAVRGRFTSMLSVRASGGQLPCVFCKVISRH